LSLLFVVFIEFFIESLFKIDHVSLDERGFETEMELNKLSENKWFSDWIVSLGDLTEIIFTSINEEISENTDIFVIDHTIFECTFHFMDPKFD